MQIFVFIKIWRYIIVTQTVASYKSVYMQTSFSCEQHSNTEEVMLYMFLTVATTLRLKKQTYLSNSFIQQTQGKVAAV